MHSQQLLTKYELKVTLARKRVLDLFLEEKQPIDAQFLIERLEKDRFDRVTVFRILNVFTEKGLIRRLDFSDGKAHYELIHDDHHHLICERCGKITDFGECNIPLLEHEILHKKHFQVTRHALEFFGICEACQKKKN